MSEHVPEAPEEGAVRHYGVVGHHHRWADGDGLASAGGTPPPAPPVGPPAPPTTPGRYPVRRDASYGSFPWHWVGGLLALGLTLAALAAIAYGIFLWVDGDGKQRGGGVTIAQVLRGNDFRPSYHAVCAITSVSGGTAYRLTLNRGGACKRTVEVVLPAEKVQWATSRRTRQLNATWVHNPRVYGSASGELVAIRKLALGEKLKVDTRHVVVRLKPTDYRRLRTQPAS